MLPRVRIRYVTGETCEGPAHDWPAFPSEGIDAVAIGNGEHWTWLSGQSVYWLYPEGDAYVMGGGPIGYDALPPEVVVRGAMHIARHIRFAPDLPQSAVKLGWWWSGSERVR